MLANERQAYILNRARSQGVVRVAELVAELGVSSMTIRRDLDVLAAQGTVDKFHGGASLRGTVPGPDAASAGSGEAHVGIVIPVDDYYFPSILAGIRDALDDQAVRRSLVRSLRDAKQERKLVEELVGSGVTGLVLAPSIDLHQPDPGYASWLLSLPVPVVLVEREVSDHESGTALSTVRTDHEAGCRQAVTHLAKLGHRGVALVAHGRSQSGTRVIDGWREAVSRSGLAGKQSPLVMVGVQYASDAGIDSMLDQLHAAQATAVICHSDELALPLTHRARLRGWSVPADLSVISHDDESAEMADPPLTAVSPPKTWIGRAAVRMLLEHLSEGDQSPTRHIVAEPRLILRSSTAPPRTSKLR